MKPAQKTFFYLLVLLLIGSTGCAGVNSFSTVARSGDTVSLALGWQQELTTDGIMVVVTDSNSAVFTYNPGDPALRALMNSYPDPISNLIVGTETGQDNIGGSDAAFASNLIEGAVTDGDKEYAETFLLLDLPAGMAVGPATIEILDSLGNQIPSPYVTNNFLNPINVEIIAGTGSSNTLNTQEFVFIGPAFLKTMERTPHFTVKLQGTTIPYAVQLDMTHNPDLDNGGVGKAYVAASRGDLKSINWTDDGTALRVIMMPSRDQVLSDMQHFKFYVAGGVTGLIVGPIDAVDVNGDPVPGVTAIVE